MSDRTLPPKLESTLRTVGVWLMALLLPFVFIAILARMGVGLVFPGWMQRSDAARRCLREEIREWQERQLEPYRSKTYAELNALPARMVLQAPECFRRHRFTLERRAGDEGGVEIVVCAAERVVWLFWASRNASFEKLASGEIVKEPEYDDSDEEL